MTFRRTNKYFTIVQAAWIWWMISWNKWTYISINHLYLTMSLSRYFLVTENNAKRMFYRTYALRFNLISVVPDEFSLHAVPLYPIRYFQSLLQFLYSLPVLISTFLDNTKRVNSFNQQNIGQYKHINPISKSGVQSYEKRWLHATMLSVYITGL